MLSNLTFAYYGTGLTNGGSCTARASYNAIGTPAPCNIFNSSVARCNCNQTYGPPCPTGVSPAYGLPSPAIPGSYGSGVTGPEYYMVSRASSWYRLVVYRYCGSLFIAIVVRLQATLIHFHTGRNCVHYVGRLRVWLQQSI